MTIAGYKLPVAIAAALILLPSNGFTQEYSGYRYFHTPSNNIWCVYSYDSKSLRCDVERRAWRDWSCKEYGCFGTAFILPSTGPSAPKRVSDTVISTGKTILGYGSSITLGNIACKAETIGLTCKNQSGGSMHLNREFFRLNK